MKENLSKVSDYIRAISEHFNHDPKYITLRVLVGNMHFDGSVSESGMKVIKAMKALSPEDHVVSHIYNELDMIRMGAEYEASIVKEPVIIGRIDLDNEVKEQIALEVAEDRANMPDMNPGPQEHCPECREMIVLGHCRCF